MSENKYLQVTALGRIIQAYLAEHPEVSQNQFARMIGVDKQKLFFMIHRRSNVPTIIWIPRVVAIAKALKQPFIWLVRQLYNDTHPEEDRSAALILVLFEYWMAMSEEEQVIFNEQFSPLLEAIVRLSPANRVIAQTVMNSLLEKDDRVFPEDVPEVIQSIVLEPERFRSTRGQKRKKEEGEEEERREE